MFGVLHAVLLRPLPIRDQTHAVVLWSEAKNQPGAHVPLRNGFLWEVSRHSRAFSGVGSVALGGATAFMARDQDRTFPVAVSFVDGGFFSVLGTVPRYGRMLAPNDDEAGAPRVVVISDRLWRQQFGGDPKVIGRSIDLQGATQLIVGITPPGFAYPADADAWSSYPQMERRFSSAPNEDGGWFDLVARLKPSVSLEQARTKVQALLRQFSSKTLPEPSDRVAELRPIADLIIGDERPALLILTTAGCSFSS